MWEYTLIPSLIAIKLMSIRRVLIDLPATAYYIIGMKQINTQKFISYRDNYFVDIDVLKDSTSFCYDPRNQQEDFFDDGWIESYSQIETLLKYLTLQEQDLIELYYKDKLMQTQIAFFFQLSQPEISHLLKRTVKKILYLKDIHPYTKERMISDLTNIVDETSINLIYNFVWMTNQTQAGLVMNLSQCSVLYRLKKLMLKVPEIYRQLIENAFKNSGIMMLSKLRKFDENVCHTVKLDAYPSLIP